MLSTDASGASGTDAIRPCDKENAGRKEIRPAGTCGTSDTAGAVARSLAHFQYGQGKGAGVM